MKNYSTQMEAAKKGIVTPEMTYVAKDEGIALEKLMALMAEGKLVIPANKNHKALTPYGLGNALRTKINVNLGTSKDCLNIEEEFKKFQTAIDLGAEAIMDLSSYGDTKRFRRELVARSTAMIGTVPIYDGVVYYNKPLNEITVEEWLSVVKMHAEDGVDFITLHCGMNREIATKIKNSNRLMPMVSRGGALIFSWMEMTGQENPFFEQYDKVLDICREYDVTISLGDACRPGCLADAGDIAQIAELVTIGELTKRAWEKDVQVIVEGPGHVPLNQIEANMTIQQSICSGAPFYVLGPLVTDVAPGYDHITSAIGGAIAASKGASFLCYVTPAEHLRLPNTDDVKEGIIACKIAAHAADIAKGLPGAARWDYEMSVARKNLDWDTMFKLALDPEKAKRYRKDSNPENPDTCTMCGKMCSIRNMKKAMSGEHVDIMD